MGLGFQVHKGKLIPELQNALSDYCVAWAPTEWEQYDAYHEYVQMHPRLGQAVMSTLAVAAATGDGMDIVGDSRSGDLHTCLLEKKQSDVYDAWVHPEKQINGPHESQAEEVFEYMIGVYCDLTDVTPQSLRSLNEDREPLRKLLNRLKELAADIPAMDPGSRRDECFKDVASQVIEEWRSDRRSISGYWRRFFGVELVEPGQAFFEKLSEKMFAGSDAAIGGAAATIAQGGLSGLIAGAGAGLMIGILSHGVKTYFRTAEIERDSPYRYLTIMEKAGVVYRSQLTE